MNFRFRALSVLIVAALALSAGRAAAQQDEGPILYPQPKPKPPTSSMLQVTCNLACNWKLDDGENGHLDAGGSGKVKVAFGRHTVTASTEDGVDTSENEVDIRPAGRTAVHFALQPVRDARLKAEQEAREKKEQEAREQAAQAAKEKAAQDARNKAAQEARDKLARDQQERERQAQQQKPAQTSGTLPAGMRPGAPRAEQKALELYDQGRYLQAEPAF